MQYFLIFISFLIFIQTYQAKIQVDPATLQLVDESGRKVLFHGVNVVYKNFPFYPKLDIFDPFESLVDEDFIKLRSWGVNFIRLHVAWEGMEPKRSEYNTTLLEVLHDIVKKAEEYNIYVLLDAHQDLLNRQYCGEGAPDWAVKTTGWATEFPKPIKFSIKRDSDGYPIIKECLKTSFFEFYLSYDVENSFQDLYDNWENIADHFASMWHMVALKFSQQQNILGYELLNEPIQGNSYKNPKLDIEGDKLNLQRFYKRIHEKIRIADNDTLIFFEPVVVEVDLSFTDTPGGETYRSKEVLSYHIYCGIPTKNDAEFKLCKSIDSEGFNTRTKFTKKFNIGAFLTEFGAVGEEEYDLKQIQYVTDEMEKRFQSWAYWQYKYYGDFTTAGGAKESFYDSDGKLQEKKVKAIARTYFYAYCGKPIANYFNPESGEYTFEFEYDKCQNNKNSEIYISEDYYYSDGFKTSLQGCSNYNLNKLSTKYYYELILPEECQGKELLFKVY